MVVLCNILGDVHQFIGHSLIPLDPYKSCSNIYIDIQSLEVRGNENFLVEDKWKFESLESLSFILAVMAGNPLASVCQNMINRKEG